MCVLTNELQTHHITFAQEYIQSLCSKPEVSKFCKHRTLCHTVAGNPVPLLTIAAPSLTLEEAKVWREGWSH